MAPHMSFLASQLNALLKEKNLRAIDLARASGLSRALISKIANGEQIWVSPDVLQKLARGIDPNPAILPATHALLLRSHLMDECSGPGKDFIEISIRSKARAGKDLQTMESLSDVKLPPKFEAYMKLIARNIGSDANVRRIVTALGGLLDEGVIPD